MNANCDEWPSLQCGHCKWFNANADLSNVESQCKRLDHKHLRFAKKIFASYDCGKSQETICRDFIPQSGMLWLYKNWGNVKAAIIPYEENDIIYLNLDGNSDVRYGVRAIDFYENTFQNEDGSLRWVCKKYMKRDRKSITGYKLITETNKSTKVR